MSFREGKRRKQIHLGVGIPEADDATDFDAITGTARVAERGLFDFLFLGRPGALTVLAALAGMTERIGLVGMVDTTSREPFEVARQLATLDHLSDGRAGWCIANSDRAAEFITVANAFWDSWSADAVLADIGTGIYTDPARIHTVEHHGSQFDVRGMATLPAGPQGHPVLLRLKAFPVVTVVLDDTAAEAAGQLVGTASHVAAEIDRYVQSDACDGFILTPHGLDEFVDRVVPLLQECGVFRTAYSGATLREQLGFSP